MSGHSLSQAAAVEALLEEIDTWSIRARSSPSELGRIVFNHGGFVPLLRQRRTLTAETAAHARSFMAAYPDSATLTESAKSRLLGEARAGCPWKARKAAPPPQAPAPMAKPRVSAAVIRACEIDGRPLPEFVTALIDMGLECWRDDRAAHGERTC